MNATQGHNVCLFARMCVWLMVRMHVESKSVKEDPKQASSSLNTSNDSKQFPRLSQFDFEGIHAS